MFISSDDASSFRLCHQYLPFTIIFSSFQLPCCFSFRSLFPLRSDPPPLFSAPFSHSLFLSFSTTSSTLYWHECHSNISYLLAKIPKDVLHYFACTKSINLSLSVFICLLLLFMWPAMAGVQTVMQCPDEGSIIIIIIHDLDAYNKFYMK